MLRQATIPMLDDPLLTRDEVATICKVKPHTVACWQSAGRGPTPIKLSSGRSGAVRYRKSAVEAWLADPVAVDSASGEPWRDERRRAVAARATTSKRSKPRRRRRAR